MLNLHEKNIFQYLAATRTSSGTTTTTAAVSDSSGGGTFQANDELDADFRIVGGTAAPAGKYPFYVNTLRPILCGGTLIHPDIVLTAARTFWMFVVAIAFVVVVIHTRSHKLGDERNSLTP